MCFLIAVQTVYWFMRLNIVWLQESKPCWWMQWFGYLATVGIYQGEILHDGWTISHASPLRSDTSWADPPYSMYCILLTPVHSFIALIIEQWQKQWFNNIYNRHANRVSAKCWNVKCHMWKVKCGMQSTECTCRMVCRMQMQKACN